MSSVSSITANATLNAQVQMAVLAKSKAIAEAQGEAAVSLLQQAAQMADQLNTHTSTGQRLDVLA